MQAGIDDQSLRRIADRLRDELADDEAPELPGLHSDLRMPRGVAGGLKPEQEAIAAGLREALAAIASTLAAEVEDPPVQTLQIALDGAEFVIRGELVRGDAARVLDLLPSYVFLVALAVADRDRALELSHRTDELIARA